MELLVTREFHGMLFKICSNLLKIMNNIKFERNPILEFTISTWIPFKYHFCTLAFHPQYRIHHNTWELRLNEVKNKYPLSCQICDNHINGLESKVSIGNKTAVSKQLHSPAFIQVRPLEKYRFNFETKLWRIQITNYRYSLFTVFSKGARFRFHSTMPT